jgi:protein-tyrosine kinase
MERIKQALEKVNKQHSTGSSQRAHPHLDSPGTTITPRSSPTYDELENISYTHTRVVKLRLDHLEKNRIVAFNKNEPKSMIFDLLRTHVLQMMEENGWRTLAVTSPTPEAGKTVIAINLAMSIAQQTNKTAMEKSLNDLLDGTADLPDVLVNPNMPRLVVLPTRNPVKKSSETLSSKKIADLIKDLRERYESRIVIFDLPPVLITDDAIALLPQIDCVLMVVANGMSTKREIEDSLRLLPAAKLIGTILNKAELEPRAYYY